MEIHDVGNQDVVMLQTPGVEEPCEVGYLTEVHSGEYQVVVSVASGHEDWVLKKAEVDLAVPVLVLALVLVVVVDP